MRAHSMHANQAMVHGSTEWRPRLDSGGAFVLAERAQHDGQGHEAPGR